MILALLLAAVTASALLLTGCEKNKDDVKLKTASEMQTYVSKALALPDAEYKSQKDEGSDKRVFTFKDRLCGFEFEAVSEKTKKYFDATVVGYAESTSVNWSEAYYGYLKDKVSAEADRIAAENGFTLNWNGTVDNAVFLFIDTDRSSGELAPVIKELGSLIKSEDKHGKLASHEIWCVSKAGSKNYKDVTAFYEFDTGELRDKSERAEFRAPDHLNG